MNNPEKSSRPVLDYATPQSARYVSNETADRVGTIIGGVIIFGCGSCFLGSLISGVSSALFSLLGVSQESATFLGQMAGFITGVTSLIVLLAILIRAYRAQPDAERRRLDDSKCLKKV